MSQETYAVLALELLWIGVLLATYDNVKKELGHTDYAIRSRHAEIVFAIVVKGLA